MGSIFSTQSAVPSTTDSKPVIFERPYFLPTPSDVLVIESFSGLSGARLNFALLYSHYKADLGAIGPKQPGWNEDLKSPGIAIDRYGRISTVSNEEWEKIEFLVRDAKEVCIQNECGYWSTPQGGSCPVGCHYDLGLLSQDNPPPQNDSTERASQLTTFHLTGHQVDMCMTSASDNTNGTPLMVPVLADNRIRTLVQVGSRYEERTVDRIPEQITKLESALQELHTVLFPEQKPTAGDPSELELGDQATSMINALRDMSSVGRTKQAMKEAFSKSRKKPFWGF
ncbi:hypothetical protein BDP27DRAFT_1403076 [Rhodocollybia butyracea]|uniref:Uncharacterized protein n=1 Tax=Rhodocollybia butyracea TaxID=206335 RepID=A0A9P5PSU1_9AGAR|nr:hypothetical protein BDP27DRAFT_1403076 [Rhodocollybia butyracea]